MHEISRSLKKAIRPVTGEVTDVALLEHQSDNRSTRPLCLRSKPQLAAASAGLSDLVVGMSLWDYRLNRWQTVDVEVITDEDEPNEQGNIELEFEVPVGFGYARRYINSDAKNWTRFGLGALVMLSVTCRTILFSMTSSMFNSLRLAIMMGLNPHFVH